MEGDELKRARERIGMTQEELAKQLDVTTQSLSRWERGAVKVPRAIELAVKHIEAEHKA